MTSGTGGNRYVDVTDTFAKKLAALEAHVSQTAHMEDLEGMLRTWLKVNAVRAGFGEERLTLDTTALSPERAADAIVLQLSRVEQAEP